MTKTMTPREEMLSFVLSTAVEGGINYWANEPHDRRHQVDAVERDQDSNVTAVVFDRVAVEGAAGARVSDVLNVRDEMGVQLEITTGVLEIGLQIIGDGKIKGLDNPRLIGVAVQLLNATSNDDAPDYDACDADCFLQATLFGQTIYG